MSVTTPHVQMPFSLGANGRPTYVEQDSVEDVASGVLNVVSCPQGACPYDSGFGIPSPLFATLPLDTSGIVAAATAQDTRLQSLTATSAQDVVTGAVDIVLTGTIAAS